MTFRNIGVTKTASNVNRKSGKEYGREREIKKERQTKREILKEIEKMRDRATFRLTQSAPKTP